MMNDLVGFISISLVSLIVIYQGLKFPSVSKILLVALIVRIIFILIGHYFITLPDSTKDAAGFENLAWSWAQSGFLNTFNNFPGYNSFFYPWIISLLYSVFGRSILMVQSLSLLFGVGSVYLGWLLAKKLWNNSIAIKVGWLLALFPSLILYSILPLREVYGSFFLLLATFGVVNWVKDGGNKSIILAISSFIGASFFHGALLIGGIFFCLIIGLANFKKSYKLILNKRISLSALLLIIISLIFLILLLSNKIYIPYITTFEESPSIDWFLEIISRRMKGDASYPEWTRINSGIEIFYKGLARIAYFLFSPLPWDVKKLTHLVGMFDGFLYMSIVYLVFLNIKVIWKDPALRIILLILSIYLFIFGIGVSNFGAGLRHRSKFVIEMILLAAPLIPRLYLFKKKLKSN